MWKCGPVLGADYVLGGKGNGGDTRGRERERVRVRACTYACLCPLLALVSTRCPPPPFLQEHFYLEPNACLVIPLENDEILTWSSTQVRKVNSIYIFPGPAWSPSARPVAILICSSARVGQREDAYRKRKN